MEIRNFRKLFLCRLNEDPLTPQESENIKAKKKSRRRVLPTYVLIELSRIFNKPKMMYCQEMCTYQYSRVERYSKSSTPRPEVEHPESPDGKCWQIHAWQPKQDFELHFPPGL